MLESGSARKATAIGVHPYRNSGPETLTADLLLRDAPYSMHALRLGGANDVVFVVWSDNAELPARLRFSTNELLSISNVVGEPIPGERDELFLEEAMGPVYVRLRAR